MRKRERKKKNTRSKVFKATLIHSEAATITAQPHNPIHATAFAVNFNEIKRRRKRKEGKSLSTHREERPVEAADG